MSPENALPRAHDSGEDPESHQKRALRASRSSSARARPRRPGSSRDGRNRGCASGATHPARPRGGAPPGLRRPEQAARPPLPRQEKADDVEEARARASPRTGAGCRPAGPDQSGDHAKERRRPAAEPPHGRHDCRTAGESRGRLKRRRRRSPRRRKSPPSRPRAARLGRTKRRRPVPQDRRDADLPASATPTRERAHGAGAQAGAGTPVEAERNSTAARSRGRAPPPGNTGNEPAPLPARRDTLPEDRAEAEAAQGQEKGRATQQHEDHGDQCGDPVQEQDAEQRPVKVRHPQNRYTEGARTRDRGPGRATRRANAPTATTRSPDRSFGSASVRRPRAPRPSSRPRARFPVSVPDFFIRSSFHVKYDSEETHATAKNACSRGRGRPSTQRAPAVMNAGKDARARRNEKSEVQSGGGVAPRP